MAKLSSYLRGSTTTTGISTSSNLVIGSDTSTGTTDQNLQVSGGSYISGNTGIGSAIPQAKLDVLGDSIVSGISTASEFSLSSIDSSITDTAVDVFVYDTRKDSDGGAWRKRTQHTSWYNETLNTATRGSRREFPAVAVLVSTSTTLTIYDGDDPDMPMWLNYGSMNSNSESPKALYAKNGIIAWAGEYGLYYSNYIEDRCRQILTSASRFRGDTGIRIGDVINTSDAKRIVNNTCNDVAMTVLPNAPIDSATGLPIPTIAVACGTAGSANAYVQLEVTPETLGTGTSLGSAVETLYYYCSNHSGMGGNGKLSLFPVSSYATTDDVIALAIAL